MGLITLYNKHANFCPATTSVDTTVSIAISLYDKYGRVTDTISLVIRIAPMGSEVAGNDSWLCFVLFIIVTLTAYA